MSNEITSSPTVQVQLEPNLTETSSNSSSKSSDNNLRGSIGITNPAFKDDFNNHRNNSLLEEKGNISPAPAPDDDKLTISIKFLTVPLDKKYEIGHAPNLNKIESPTMDCETQQKKPKIWRKCIGILFTLLAALCFSLMLVVTKKLPHLHPITQGVWRQLVKMCISGGIMFGFKLLIPSTRDQVLWKGIIDINNHNNQSNNEKVTSSVKIHWNVIGKILIFGVLINIGMLCRLTALNYLTIADATVMTYLSLVFVLILSHFILHEKCLIVQSLMAGLIILGAFIIAFLTGASEFDTSTLIGICIKIIDGVTTALFLLGMRYLRALHFAPNVFISNTIGFFLAMSASFTLDLFKLPDNLIDMFLICAMASLSTIGHISLLLALKFERTSTVSLIRCADVPFAFIWQIFIFNLAPDSWTWIGTLLVCTGVLITSFSKLIAELPIESPIQKRFGFLLK